VGRARFGGVRLRVDTHTLIWWLGDSPALSREAEAVIRDPANDVWVIAVSAFEIAQKHRMGKLPFADRLARNFDSDVSEKGFLALSISPGEARLAGAMLNLHRDPLDRILIAHALLKDMTLVSNEKLFDSFGVARLW